MWWEIKDHLEIKNGELYIGNRSAIEIAKKFGTPIYVYNLNRVRENYRRFYSTVKKYTDLEVRIHYSMKANFNSKILKALFEEGSYIDAVSIGEVKTALSLGFEKDQILYTGVFVSNAELKELVELGIRINLDSISEMKRLYKISNELGKRGLEVGIRIDPGTKGLGHSYKVITAGKTSHGLPIKFSIPEYDVAKAIVYIKEFGFKLVGMHEHVGSNWSKREELLEFLSTLDVLIKKAEEAKEMLGYELEFLDLGGGVGIRYRQEQGEFPLDEYAKKICERIKESKLKLEAICFEPGRYIVADAGILLVEVVEVKERYGYIIVGVNSGFNHLIRPAFYGSYHEIVNCSKADKEPDSEVIIAGNLCETGDVFTPEPRKMPMPEEGDILAILHTGAYGYSMASHYNLRDLPKEICLPL